MPVRRGFSPGVEVGAVDRSAGREWDPRRPPSHASVRRESSRDRPTRPVRRELYRHGSFRGWHVVSCSSLSSWSDGDALGVCTDLPRALAGTVLFLASAVALRYKFKSLGLKRVFRTFHKGASDEGRSYAGIARCVLAGGWVRPCRKGQGPDSLYRRGAELQVVPSLARPSTQDLPAFRFRYTTYDSGTAFGTGRADHSRGARVRAWQE